MRVPEAACRAAFAFLALGVTAGAPLFAGESSAPPSGSPIRVERINHNDRIVTGVVLNGHPARLAIDTGAAAPFIVFASAAARLGLKPSHPTSAPKPKPGEVSTALVGPCEFQWMSSSGQTSIAISPETGPMTPLRDIDGLMGWPAIRENYFVIKVSDAELPMELVSDVKTGSGVTRFRIVGDDVLELESTSGGPGSPLLIIDTGSDLGVVLAPREWEAWKRAHPHAPMTNQTSYMFADGFGAEEIAWADEIQVGELRFHHIPVSQAGISYTARATADRPIVALGLAALRELVLLVDWKNREAVAAPDNQPDAVTPHNRFGFSCISCVSWSNPGLVRA